MPASKLSVSTVLSKALHGQKSKGSSKTSPPLSVRITEQIPTEIYELMMDHLDDVPSILACNLVCRTWHPRSREILHQRTACHPGPSKLRPATISCAAPYLDGGVIYGALDGVYFASSDGSQKRLASLPDVVQIELFIDVDLLICIADSQLITFPLRALVSSTYQELDVVRMQKPIIMISVLRSKNLGERHRVCAVRKIPKSAPTFKLFDIVFANDYARLVEDSSCFIEQQVTSVHLCSRRLLAVAIEKAPPQHSGFDVINIGNAESQPFLDSNDPALKFVYNTRETGKPIGISRFGDHFLVSYSKLGFLVNKLGRSLDNLVKIQWNGTPSSVVVHGKHILALTPEYIDVWQFGPTESTTPQLAQQVKGSYALLNDASEEAVLVLNKKTKDVVELEFHHEVCQ
ncbi:Sulfhydryl oxidase [Mycena indigotica]|uniref:Sulfhydryl oxidase n=1 Tax=Mycena indigotica TaxID=2126181 RepID=A0A8H6W9S5_9AGAR|nr:Sulfhydryl oxidase [Mycena indigotica]KAF7310007.1 Sulfhydryl oxidase [Mycena indigotica]